MKFVEMETRLSPKAALIHAFEYYPGKNLMIMMTQELFKKFDDLKEARKDNTNRAMESKNSEETVENEVVYDLYENEDVDNCEYYGKAKFQLIRGTWVMTKFDSDTFKYEARIEHSADIIILLK